MTVVANSSLTGPPGTSYRLRSQSGVHLQLSLCTMWGGRGSDSRERNLPSLNLQVMSALNAMN